MRLAAALAMVAVMTGTGCGSTPSPSSASPPRLEFLETVAVPLADPPGVDVGAFGGIATVRIGGTRGSVEVQSVQLLADPGLGSTYLGFTDCHKGCAGAALTDAEGMILARNSLLGTLPADISEEDDASRKPVSFVIEMQPTAEGWDRLRSGACLYVHAARVSLSDGTQEQVRAPGGHWIAAVFIGHVAPAVSASC